MKINKSGNMKDINLILENIVFMESLRRGYAVTVGKVGTKEIDFVCQKQEQKIYIRCEMTPTSVGGEQQISISGGSQSPI